MIVVCDRCKEHPTIRDHILFTPGWGSIEVKHPDMEQLYLCPSCYEEFRQFIINEKPADGPVKEKPAEE